MVPILGEPLAPSSRAGGQACCLTQQGPRGRMALTQQSPRRQMAWAGWWAGLGIEGFG